MDKLTMEQKDMLKFVQGFKAEGASASQKRKYHQYLDQLCEADAVEALKIKAWGYYGGNELFACNWEESERYLLRLVEVAEDPYACNSLGYIYYYGRTTEGVPDYAKAFKYFSVAALYGIYEAMYKVADLCLKGKGIPMRCPRGAKNVIEWLYYDQLLPLFTNGKFDCEFADVAARMGRLQLAEAKEAAEKKSQELLEQAKEKGAEELPKITPLYDAAYELFKLAEYALELRAPYNQYGDTAVMAGVRQGLEEARTSLSYSDVPQAELEQKAAIRALYSLVNFDAVCVKFKTKGKKKILKVKLLDRNRGGFHKRLLSLPTVDYCRFTDKLVLTAEKLKVKQKNYKGKKLSCCSFYEHNGILIFEDVDGGILRLKVDGLAIQRKLKPKDLKEYKMVSVTFHEGGKEYDYLYNLEEPVTPGDKVIVVGYQGETEVTVTKVFTVPAYQLKLPLNRYKAVVSLASAE